MPTCWQTVRVLAMTTVPAVAALAVSVGGAGQWAEVSDRQNWAADSASPGAPAPHKHYTDTAATPSFGSVACAPCSTMHELQALVRCSTLPGFSLSPCTDPFTACTFFPVVVMDPWDGPLPLGAAMFAAEPMCRDNTLYCICGAPWDLLSLAPLSLFGMAAFAVRGCKKAPIREVKTLLERQLEEDNLATQTEPPPVMVATH